MVSYSSLVGSKNFFNFIKCMKYKREYRKKHPTFFSPEGILIFCGAQGTGKTISAVQYVRDLTWIYPKVILVTNVDIKGLNPLVKVIEYDGISCLENINNGINGVIYLIDEIHLEFNSLESKNIPIEIMIEVSQGRKQRKHIVGTSQQFLRLAKPIREQVKNLVICKNYFGCVQINRLIDGSSIREIDGKVKMDIKKKCFWFHTPNLYESYDTYAKMRRYRKVWNGVSRDNIY